MNVLIFFLFFEGYLLVIYGFIVLLFLGRGSLDNVVTLFVGLVFIFSGIYLLKIKGKDSSSWINFVSTTIVISLVIFMTVEGMIIARGFKQPEKGADYVILLGCQMKDDGPSKEFKARIEAAYEYLQDEPQAILIVSGAKGSFEPVSEAEGARQYLLKKGFPDERIVLEENSRSTRDNILFSVLKIKDGGDDPAKAKVVIVSSYYHLFRAEYLARKYGLTDVSTKGCVGVPVLLPHYYIREFFAYFKERIF